jgi:ABC-type multidrug transport system fused ATPase/permease subunit
MVGLTVPPYLLSRTIDDGLAPGHAGALAWWLAALLSAGLANAWLGITRHRVMTRLRMDALHRTVLAVVRQSTRLGAALPGRVAAGEVITIGVSDVAVISQTLTIAGPGVGAVVAYLVIAALLLAVSAPLAVVVLVGVPALAVLVGPLLGRLRRIQHGYRDQQGALTARFADLAAGLRVLNGLGGKDTFADRYRRDSQRLVAEGYRVAAVTSWVLALGLGLPTVFLAAVIWLAARLAASGGLTPGQLVAVYGYAALLVVPVSFFLEGAHDLTHGLVAARRVTNFLSLPPTDLPASTRAAPGGLAALHDPGSGVTVPVALLTALVSGQPADPVAIVDRLGGFSSSQATWGGVPLARIDPGEVRRRILVADNEADLFTGTLRDTILGPQAAATGTSGVVGADAGADAGAATDVEVMRVVEAAAARDVVDGLAGGLDGELTAQGRNLSGGQRQRVRLARALLADPEVLLAVEPTSAVDAHTEATIAERLRAYRASRTTLVTSTSPLLLDRVDLVHYLVDGRVVASGTHRHLLATQPGYHHLVQRGDDDPADLDGTAGPPGWFDTVAAQVASNDETTGIAGRHGGQVNRAGEVADVGLGEGGGSEGARW